MSHTWISAQNLIGGFAFGAEKSLGAPSVIVTGFAKNDLQYINYTNNQRKLDVPIVEMSPDYKQNLSNKSIPEVDFWFMTPICSGMTSANTSKNECTKPGNPDNIQNQNMYNLLRLAINNNAKCIAFENAPQLAQPLGKGVRAKLKKIANEHGYSFQTIFVDTFMHGIPQSRKRSFAMFFKDGKCRRFFYENVEKITLDKYLKKIPKDVEYQDIIINNKLKDDKYFNALKKVTKTSSMEEFVAWCHGNLDVMKKGHHTFAELMKMIGFEKFEEELKDDRFFNRLKTKGHVYDMTWAIYFRGYMNSLMFKSMNVVHPDYAAERSFNLRECMHLMGLPHDYKTSDGFNTNMVCQNVPVCTANYIVRNCIDALDGKLDEVECKDDEVYMQNNVKKFEFLEKVNSMPG